MLARFATVSTGWIDILALLFLCFLIRGTSLFSRRKRCYYLWSVVITMLVIFSEGITVLASGPPGAAAHVLHLLGNAVGFSLSAALPALLAHLFSDKKGFFPSPWLIWSPVAITAVLSVFSCFTGWIFFVGPDNSYQRGPLFFAFVVTYLYSFVLLILVTLSESERLGFRDRVSIMCLTGLIIAGTTVQVFIPALYTSWHCATVGLLLYYIFLRELCYRVDPVTQVLCRSSFDQDLFTLPASDTAVLMFDLNNFKQVNDRHGHEMGDRCLYEAGQLLEYAFSTMGKCYRVGGDEFAVLATSYSESLLNRCVHFMMTEIRAQRENLPMMPYISYGCGVCRGDVQQARAIADAQMYEYKGKEESELHP